ncbi:MAG: hypothetical protein D9V47_02530 [Clostridia bacterium]|nr:MAG: hypothetical protein D9V47_02530 [Clostridia bacterium]
MLFYSIALTVAIIWGVLLSAYLVYYHYRGRGTRGMIRFLAMGISLAAVNALLLTLVIWPPLDAISLVLTCAWVAGWLLVSRQVWQQRAKSGLTGSSRYPGEGEADAAVHANGSLRV